MVYLVFQGAAVDDWLRANASIFYIFIPFFPVSGVVRIGQTGPRRN